MRQRFAAVLLFACLINADCDDTPTPPPELVTERPAEGTAPPRPTTQELLEGQRKLIALGSLPLTASVPAGWEVKTVEGTDLTMLKGPSPGGEVEIQLSSRPIVSGERFVAIVNGAKSEMQQNPESIRMADMRPIPGARVLERQRVGKVPTVSVLSDEPDPDNSPTFNWTLTVFIPRGSDYETHELNFIGLSLRQYEKDEKLLREIVDSVALASAPATGAAPAAGATTAPAQ